MKEIFLILFILTSLFAIILNAGAWSRRSWFAGSILLSFSMGGLLWVNKPYYLVLLLLVFLLLIDFIVYFFARTLAVLPEREKEMKQTTKHYLSTVVFLVSCLALGLIQIIWSLDASKFTNKISGEPVISSFHRLIWGNGFLFILMVLVLFTVSALGVFFMAKREA